ncbi:hypothetical protein FMUND_7836 [Fusarium mundagurra]|uniref:BTB domain-containing protein n=1 Tax=Fusarium mundagurra TaxID=1567541 RepID=A0A8H5YL93_9HYPO|nr:hypothetical protein FMUND_7836 [Fusarium mundagurra]
MSSESELNTPVQVLTPNGDVVLVVGREEARIQIASEFLTLASPVFDAMLNLKFSEGIKLHEGDKSPVDIKLPEDNGLATAQALKTLYGSYPEMLLLTPDQIQKVSIVVDKYDMSARFAMAGTVWMDCEPINLEDAWKLMTASYWLDHQVGFRRMSECVIRKLNHAQIFRLANETFDVALGLKWPSFCCTMHSHRSWCIRREGCAYHASRLRWKILWECSRAVPVQAITALADLIKPSTGGEGDSTTPKKAIMVSRLGSDQAEHCWREKGSTTPKKVIMVSSLGSDL